MESNVSGINSVASSLVGGSCPVRAEIRRADHTRGLLSALRHKVAEIAGLTVGDKLGSIAGCRSG